MRAPPAARTAFAATPRARSRRRRPRCPGRKQRRRGVGGTASPSGGTWNRMNNGDPATSTAVRRYASLSREP
jgi:hypothetical protein